MQPYTQQFYRDQRQGSRQSAQEVVPIVLGMIRPRSVVDIGCGVGTWLSVFNTLGCEEIFGVDGDYVDKTMLEIPADKFLAFDLTQPLYLDRQFDLVVSLEVAEHLPGAYAETFVDSLTRLGPVIFFSAAIPFQGGTHHVNEQWPEYWLHFFHKKGFVVLDPIRKRVWNNDNVEYYYAQNGLMFVRKDYLESHPLLKKEAENTHVTQLAMVHPRRYLEEIAWTQRLHQTMQDIASLIPPEETLILADQEQMRHIIASVRRTIPFLERDGNYWGPPPDDATAIRELERLRQTGVGFFVLGWPALWWFDYYSEFSRYLHTRFRCLLRNDHVVIFNLHQGIDA